MEKTVNSEHARTAPSEPGTPPDASGRSGGHHLPVLDGLRAFSILFVLAAHLLPLNPALPGLNDAFGVLGMSLFFCLSGFLITTTLHRNPEALTFLVKRVFRIFRRWRCFWGSPMRWASASIPRTFS